MIGRLVSTELMDLVQRSLDSAALSHKVVADNLANVDTPNFKRSEVVFSEKLKRAMEAKANASQRLEGAVTDSRHIGFNESPSLDSIQSEVVVDRNTTQRNDGNNVDIDREVSLMAQNTVWYQTLAQITQMQFGQLRSAITEGRR